MQITVTKKDKFKLWVEKTNLISEEQGELSTLNTTAQNDVVSAINEKHYILTQIKLSHIVDDLAPVLGNDLDLNTHSIVGTGDIIISGSYDGGLASNTTTTTHNALPEANSTSICTTELCDASIVAAIGLGIPWAGDVNGLLGGPILLNSGVIGMPEIDKSTSFSAGELQFFGTDGGNQLTFINTTELGAIGGEDLSGDISSIEIINDKINIDELDLSDGSDGHVITTDGSGTMTFNPPVTESSISPTVGEQTFNINYIVGMIVVYLNGIKQINGQDFTADNGTSVILNSAIAIAGSTIDFQIYGIN